METRENADRTVWVMSKAELRALIGVSSTDVSRVNLTVVCLDPVAKVAAATDGHRLIMAECQGTTGADADRGCTLIERDGADSIAKAARVSDAIEIEPDLEAMTATATIRDRHHTTRATLTVRLSAVTFPPYRQVVPKDRPCKTPASEIGLTGAYLAAMADLAKAAETDTVRMLPGDKLDPVVFRAENADECTLWTHVLMPCRL